MAIRNIDNMYSDGTDGKQRRRWVILAVAYLCFVVYSVVFQSIPPILSILMSEFDLTYAQAGLLMSFFALPGIIVCIPGGMLADRYGQKTIGIVCLVLMIVGSMMLATGRDVTILLLGRVVSGIGAVTLVVLAPQLISQWFSVREIGKAMGVYVTAMPVGTMLALNLLSIIGGNLGWRTGIWLTVGLSLLTLVVFASLVSPPVKGNPKIIQPSEGFFQGLARIGTRVWLIGAVWGFFNAASIAMYTFTPKLLEEAGFSITSAGFFTSLSMLPSIPLSPILGLAIDKIGRKPTIIMMGAVFMAIFVALIPTNTGWIFVLFFILFFGIAQTLTPAPAFALLPEVCDAKRLGLAFGIMYTAQNLGVVIGPAGAGMIKDVTGTYYGAYALMAGLTLLIIPMIGLLRLKSRIPKMTSSGT